jgi:O-6-methylguanine DNA methyltransferase
MRHDHGLIIFKTPLGWAGVAASEQGIYRVVLPKKQKQDVQRELESSECGVRISELASGVHNVLRKAGANLRKYFSSKRVLFDLPLDMRYYTQFQKAVWQAAAGIPYGETRSYAWVAKKIGNARAVRAVGQALGANPIPIIIPCHRVIGSSGKLCGFADGLELKQKLLELENRNGGNGDREKRGNT